MPVHLSSEELQLVYEIHDALLLFQGSEYLVCKRLKSMLVKCTRNVVKKAKLSWPVLLILRVHSKGCTKSCVAF